MPQQSLPTGAVFLSYASQDADAAARIAEALRAAGIEVWFDRSDLRGGVAWDAQIKKQIHNCALFLPVISAHTNARIEGYFRREWNLAIRRILDRAQDAELLVPVVVDETREADARVPDEFLNVQWTWLPGGETPPAFVQHMRQLLGADRDAVPEAQPALPATTRSSGRRLGSARPSSMSRARPMVLASVALLLTAGAGAYWYLQGVSDVPAVNPAPATAAPDAIAAPNAKSIAVLPFTDMSAERNQEYMADGIAEELLNLLAQVPDLKVIARSSSFAFKGKAIDIAEIAGKLNVAHVLEGSVRKSGNQLRITAQLIRTADSMHVWSESYDRPLNDIFAVQDEIANAIVQALQIKFMGGSLSHLEGGTQNLAAYQLYLRAVTSLSQNTQSSLDTAAANLEKAIKLDPNYGRAWSALAVTVESQADNGYLPATEGYERSRKLALHALQLSPALAEVHGTLAYLHQALDWNWTAAETEVKRALAIDATDPAALQAAGLLSSTLGHWDDAERQLRQALIRDPLNTFTIYNLGLNYYLASRFVEAERVFVELLEQEPGFTWTRRMLGKTLLAQGKPDAALAMVQQEADETNRLVILPIVLQAVGRYEEADQALNTLIAKHGDTWPSYVAQAYAYRGDHDRALEWLERAYQKNDVSLTAIVGEPLLKGMADDPRYRAFLRKMNLPESGGFQVLR